MTRLRRKLLDEGYGRTLWGWAQTLAAQCDEHDLRRLEQLVALGYTFGPRAGVRPSQFVAFVRETKVEDPSATRVRVMTVHQAKGLQFDIVVLPELDQPLKSRTAARAGRGTAAADRPDRTRLPACERIDPAAAAGGVSEDF